MTLGRTDRSVPRRPFWSAHSHSRYSINDAMPKVPAMVQRAVELGYPALGLTDHGGMPGVVQLYNEAKKHDLPVLPGTEMYLTSLAEAGDRKSMHLTMLSYTSTGYRNLVALNNQAHRQFKYRPRLDFADIASAAEHGLTAGIAIGTGCRSGPVVRALTERGEAAAKQVVRALASWFPRVYVEVMDHHFAADGWQDSDITTALYEIACELDLPMILTADSHYLRPEEQELHDALKTLVSWSDDPAEGQFSGHGYYLPTWEDLSHIPPGIAAACEDGLADLAAAAKVTIPELDTFTLKIPDVTKTGTALQLLRERVYAALELYVAEHPKDEQEARERVDDEDMVIDATGMATYLALVLVATDYMTEKCIWFHTRGSAAGSFWCYLLGITQYDPLTKRGKGWDIRMDRFLSGDRTSPPDIDLDIEHTRRDEVITMLESRYGYELRQVGTQPTYGLDADPDEEGDQRGSLRVRYFATLRKTMGRSVSWSDVTDEDKQMLYALADYELISGIGAHPGGYIVAEDEPTVGCLPMAMIASSRTLVTALDKGEVEAMGFPKIDFLGSKALTAIRYCCELIVSGDDQPGESALDRGLRAKAYYAAIPLDDKDTMKRVREGKTTGLFQLGGVTNRRGLEDMKPTKTMDIVAAQALFRPAPLNSGFTKIYMRRRDKVEKVPAMHADINAETKDTYGVALYQEQVVGLLRRIGVPPKQLTKLLKAVKASGKAGEAAAKVAVDEELESIVDQATARGWAQRDIDYLAQALVDYGAGYSFGKGHSVTYGNVGYNTGYLATHEPLAWWTGTLNAYMGSKNGKGEPLEPMYVRAARQDDVRVVDAHVNLSGVGYTPDPEKHSIRRGLVSVKNVGTGAAREIVRHQPYTSLVDFGQRVSSKVTGAAELVYGKDPTDCTGAVLALGMARAFNGIEPGTPVVKKTARSRKCVICNTTFATPAELTQHFTDDHPDVETSDKE